MIRAMNRVLLAAAVVSVTVSASFAQQSTTATATKKFEVLSVDGSQLVVRLPEGTRELSVPDDFRFDVDGQQLSVQQLKPGMRGTATITTRTTVTPVSVTEIKNGTVMQSSGSTIIVRTDEGFKSFTQGDVDKRGVKIIREGKVAQISDFRTGDKLTATIVTSKPAHVLTEREVKATLATVPPAVAAAAAPTMAAPPVAATTGAAPAAPRSLPKTASSWPVLGLAGILSLAMGLALTIRRRSVG